MTRRMQISPREDLRATERGARAASDVFPFECVASRIVDMPEKRLMLAVLLDAILQLRRQGSTGAIEAADWIHGRWTDSSFSFVAVCEALGLDPGYLARGVFAWARQANELAPLRRSRLRRSQTRALRLSTRRRPERSLAAL
ncbi:MAG: hypothetical protein HY271_17470 [Deltaproteobacteria bacterium]|nr:hypothetical protein [Deltaproteobacteria bacterium]